MDIAPAVEPEEAAADENASQANDDVDPGDVTAAAKKKRNRRRKKKAASKDDDSMPPPAGWKGQDNSRFRILGNWKDLPDSRQTEPPTLPIHELFPDGRFPVGELLEYGPHVSDQRKRETDEERRERERILETNYEEMRRGAEAHRQVRRFAQSYIQPGMTMVDIVQRLEQKSKELIAADGFKSGWGFPTGVSIDHCAAHYTPNYGDKTVLHEDNLIKVDFGVHVGGRIIDSAFSVAFKDRYDPLIQASKEATQAGVAMAGIDASFSEVGAAIHEAMEAFEVELDGKMHRIRPVRNLSGHTIEPYKIHAGKSLPITRNSETTRMEEGEVYAIETFASTGKGYVHEDGECSHYAKMERGTPIRNRNAKVLLHGIEQHFQTLPFCRRWLDDLGMARHALALKCLVDEGIVQNYPPLCDVRGSFVSQSEHTVLLRPTCKEVLSRGDDY
eukprot:Polyplicarium_translucidae@DN1135_c0_g1_i1.p1